MSVVLENASPAVPCNRSADARAARLAKFQREQLIIDYLNRGVSVAEIAARVGVSEKRMRAIIREILARRMPQPPEEFVAIQMSRLNEALLVAYSAMSATNLKAVDTVVRIVREMGRYHGLFASDRRRPEPDSRIAVRGLEPPAERAMVFGAALVCGAEFALQDFEVEPSTARALTPQATNPSEPDGVEAGRVRRCAAQPPRQAPTDEAAPGPEGALRPLAGLGPARNDGNEPTAPAGDLAPASPRAFEHDRPAFDDGASLPSRPTVIVRSEATNQSRAVVSEAGVLGADSTAIEAQAASGSPRFARDDDRLVSCDGAENPPQRLEKTESAPGTALGEETSGGADATRSPRCPSARRATAPTLPGPGAPRDGGPENPPQRNENIDFAPEEDGPEAGAAAFAGASVRPAFPAPSARDSGGCA